MKRPCRLEKGHDFSQFDCGEEPLNNFLKKYALASQASNATVSYVVLEGSRIIAYYSLAVGAIAHERAPDRMGKGLGKYEIPIILIARLAVDKTFQGKHLGKHLLKDALSRAFSISQQVGIRCIVVDAKNERARQFYQRFNFEPWPVDCFRLYLLIKDVRKTVGSDSIP